VNPSNPVDSYIFSVVAAVHKIFIGLSCLAVALFILFLFITFIRHACYKRPLRDYFTMLWIIISSIFKLFIKFFKGFFYGLIISNLVVIIAIVLFVFTHFFLVKVGFVADSFKLTHINIELNSENKSGSIKNLVFLTLLFDVAIFSLISYNLSEVITIIFVCAYCFVIYFLMICSYTYTPEFFFDIINNLCEYILYTTIKPFHMLSLFIVGLINFFFYFVKDVAQEFWGFFLPPVQVPILFSYFFESFGFKPDAAYSRKDWSVFTADICVTIAFSCMIVFSENKLVLKLKGKTYVCLVIILFFIILLFFSFHIIDLFSLLSSYILPDHILSFSDFVNHFSKYAADKKSKYRDGSNVVFCKLTLQDLNHELGLSYSFSTPVILYALCFILISGILMFLFIYLGIPYFCAEKFNSNHSLYKANPLNTFPYGYPVCLDYLKIRASLNIFYVLFVIALFFLLINVYFGFYAKHIFVFCMDNVVSLYAQFCYIVLHIFTFFALGPFTVYSSGLDILLTYIVVIFVICPSFFFTMFLLFHLRLIPTTGLFSYFYSGN